MEVHERLMQSDQTYRNNRIAIENFTENYMRSYLDRGEPLRTGTLTIPVVVHVVYNTAAQNISDAQIQSQIRILNEDFRKLNADVGSVPAVFQPLVTDAYRIRTCLYYKNRNMCNRIYFNDFVKFTSSGGRDAWPRDKYLNLWVCKLGGGLLGYAAFPGGAANVDGVVCTYTAFGDIGTATAPFHKGRTATHEIGHWLDLRHIWGDDCPSGDQCAGSDLVADTP